MKKIDFSPFPAPLSPNYTKKTGIFITTAVLLILSLKGKAVRGELLSWAGEPVKNETI
tara:strand:- start:1080 stop:1253 length:174 start_codon:yes stop_codon:yes gene_type:complete